MSLVLDTLPAMARKLMPESEKKIAVGSRVEPRIFAALESIAQEEDRTISYIIERVLKQWLDARDKQKPKR